MERQQIFDAVVELMCTVEPRLDAAAVALDDTPLGEHGFTSLGVLQLAAMVGDRFDVSISDAETLRIGSTRRLVDLVEAKLAPAVRRVGGRRP